MGEGLSRAIWAAVAWTLLKFPVLADSIKMDSSELEDLVSHFTARRTMLPAIHDLESGWYLGWYLHLRLDEEILRSRRYGFEMSVIYVTLEHKPEKSNSAEWLTFHDDLAGVTENILRQTDIPGTMGGNHLAICLPQTEAEGAATVMERLVRALTAYQPRAGKGTFPDDGEDAEILLGVALNEILMGEAQNRINRSRSA